MSAPWLLWLPITSAYALFPSWHHQQAQPSKKGEKGTNGVLPPQSGDTKCATPLVLCGVPVLFLRQLVSVRCRALLVDRQLYRHVCTSLRPPASVNDVPLLVPVGEALDAYIPDLETLTRREAEEQAMHEKELVPHLAQPRDRVPPFPRSYVALRRVTRPL